MLVTLLLLLFRACSFPLHMLAITVQRGVCMNDEVIQTHELCALHYRVWVLSTIFYLLNTLFISITASGFCMGTFYEKIQHKMLSSVGLYLP